MFNVRICALALMACSACSGSAGKGSGSSTLPGVAGGTNGTTSGASGGGSTGGSTSTGGTPIDPNVTLPPAPAGPAGLTFVGRTIPLDPNNPAHVRFAWAGVAVGANFTGTAISATLRDYGDNFNGEMVDSFYDVVVDGNKLTTFRVTTDANTYVLAQNLASGQHTLWLTKRTEGMLGSTEFFGLTPSADGNILAPPAAPTRHIEVIGASIETGYGADGENCTGYKAAQQNQDAAWPQLTANALKAQLHNSSFSGKGLVNNIDPDLDPVNTLPVMYELADSMDFNVQWDFSQWKADVVIFDIGGNDWEGLSAAPDPNTFESAYVAFVQHVLTYYPGAEVYITMNSTDPSDQRAGLIPDFKAVVAQLSQLGVPHVHYFEFLQYTGSSYGCDFHPDVALHQVMANEIAPQVQADMGW